MSLPIANTFIEEIGCCGPPGPHGPLGPLGVAGPRSKKAFSSVS